jgi:hypothetical protein
MRRSIPPGLLLLVAVALVMPGCHDAETLLGPGSYSLSFKI